ESIILSMLRIELDQEGCGRRCHVPHKRNNADQPNNLGKCHPWTDRKSTRLNSSHLGISYAVFCLKKKKKKKKKKHNKKTKKKKKVRKNTMIRKKVSCV